MKFPRSRPVRLAVAVVIGSFLASEGAMAKGADPPAMLSDADPVKSHRVVPNPAFGVGERLIYNVEFLGITAGQATLEIPEIIDIGDAKAFRLISESRTTGFFDRIYPVLNRHESYIDTKKLCTLKYVENQREKGTFRDRFSLYDQKLHLATVTQYALQKKGRRQNDAPPKVETVETPPFVQDVLSAMYFLRTQDLQVGQVHRVPTISGIKTYELIVTIPRKRTIKTPLGKFQTLELIPELKYDGLFINKGKSYVYVTDDIRKLPVLLKSKVAVGSFRAVLTENHTTDLVTEKDVEPDPGT